VRPRRLLAADDVSGAPLVPAESLES